MKKILSMIVIIMAVTPMIVFADNESNLNNPEDNLQITQTVDTVRGIESTQVSVAVGATTMVYVDGAVRIGISDNSVLDAYLQGNNVVLTGKRTGYREVYVYGEGGSNVVRILEVTVTERVKTPSISQTSMTLGYDCEGSIQYWDFPCNGNHNYDVTSSNYNIIDVFEIDAWYDGKYGYDEFGRDIHTAYFYACGYGTATITVSDGTYKKTCKVTVPDKRVRLNKTSVKLKKGKKITLKVLNAKGKVTWKSSKKKVATVSKTGVVKAKKKGTAIITAKVNGKAYKCKIKVVKK